MNLNADAFFDAALLIVCTGDGPWWSVQCGGVQCNTRRAQGVVIQIGRSLIDVDDCSCYIHGFDKAANIAMANKIDSALQEQTRNGALYQIKFDFDKINEMIEGWWPVLVRMYDDDNDTWHDLAGYVSAGNCD